MPHDSLFATPQDAIARFSFDERVAACFPDMISRSVPGYGQITAMVGVMALRYLPEQAHVYDLGCSHGAATLALCQQLEGRVPDITAVDLSPAMIAQARQHLETHLPVEAFERIRLIEGDICTLELKPSDMIIINFTLQFLPPEQRLHVISRLHHALKPGGILILSEKITCDDPEAERILYALHHDFKRANGYSDLEISQKRTALEDVMRTDTLSAHHARLAEAGFVHHFTWFQYLNFASLIAFKE
ncbi:carboxy-S-adenosyl-L-methionine synthase CmoA [Zymobacter sp. IVIA_5232.4 C2]|uniref:carboxy-S-adenosyl-L-methionine synthase CmoA n=1 Tax=Zymobacter sp. IVIA_5232.4 C2 TaxID=3394855 RepID=UPI0039C231BD